MGNFFKSLFSSPQAEEAPGAISKDEQKKFDIFKYDGIRARQMGQIPYAIRCFTEALNIRDDFETINYLAAAYTANGEPEEALQAACRMVSLEPGNITTYLVRANILLLMEKGEEAIADCAKAIELEGDNPLAWFLQGKARRITNPQGATEDLAKAIAAKDGFTDAYLLRAEILLEANRPAEALPDAEKAIELAPDEESAYLLRGKIHDKLSNFTAAAEDYERGLNLNPFNTDACMLLGALLMNTGDVPRAIRFFDEAIEIKPDFAPAYRQRAKAKELTGEREGAEADIKTAAELRPEDGQAAGQVSFEDMYKGGIY